MKDKKIKVWRFYLLPFESIKRLKSCKTEQKYRLYAITDDEHLAIQFMKERDIESFIVRDSKMLASEYRKLANKNRFLVLENIKYSTKGNKINKYNLVEIVSNQNEKNEVEETITNNGLSCLFTDGQFRNTNPELFNIEYYKALKNLQYVNLYELTYNDASFATPNFGIDEIAMLMNMFSHTFDHKFLKQ